MEHTLPHRRVPVYCGSFLNKLEYPRQKSKLIWLQAGGRYIVGREPERGEGPESRARQRNLEFGLLYLVDTGATLNVEDSSRFGNGAKNMGCCVLRRKTSIYSNNTQDAHTVTAAKKRRATRPLSKLRPRHRTVYPRPTPLPRRRPDARFVLLLSLIHI